jgi:hypothetical protein
MATVAEVAGIAPDVLRSSTQRRSVGRARMVAAHLLRTHCRLRRAEIGCILGRSDQTVSDLTARAGAALAGGGPIAELIMTVSQSLDDDSRGCDESIQSTSNATANSLESRLTRRPLPALRAWRRAGSLTQQTLATKASISRETLIRIEAGRQASNAGRHPAACECAWDRPRNAAPTTAGGSYPGTDRNDLDHARCRPLARAGGLGPGRTGAARGYCARDIDPNREWQTGPTGRSEAARRSSSPGSERTDRHHRTRHGEVGVPALQGVRCAATSTGGVRARQRDTFYGKLPTVPEKVGILHCSAHAPCARSL